MEHFVGRKPSSRITGLLVWSGSSMFLSLIRLGSVSCLQRCTLWGWKCDYYTSAEVKARHPLRASKRCQRQGDGVAWGIFTFLTKGRDLTLWLLAQEWWQAICRTNCSMHIIMHVCVLWFACAACICDINQNSQLCKLENIYTDMELDYAVFPLFAHTKTHTFIHIGPTPSPSACIYSINGSQ